MVRNTIMRLGRDIIKYIIGFHAAEFNNRPKHLLKISDTKDNHTPPGLIWPPTCISREFDAIMQDTKMTNRSVILHLCIPPAEDERNVAYMRHLVHWATVNLHDKTLVINTVYLNGKCLQRMSKILQALNKVALVRTTETMAVSGQYNEFILPRYIDSVFKMGINMPASVVIKDSGVTSVYQYLQCRIRSHISGDIWSYQLLSRTVKCCSLDSGNSRPFAGCTSCVIAALTSTPPPPKLPSGTKYLVMCRHCGILVHIRCSCSRYCLPCYRINHS